MTRERKKESQRLPNRPLLEEALAARRDLVGAQFQSLDDPFAQMLATVTTHTVVGNQLIVSGKLDDAGRERLKAEAGAAVPRLADAVEERMADLRHLLGSVHPVGVLVRVCWANLFRVGDYFEPTFQGSEAKVEVLAGLLLTTNDLDPASPDPPDPEVVQQVLDALTALALWMRLLVLAMNISWEDDRADLRVWSQLRWLSLRGSSYVQHATELAKSVLQPLNDQMNAELGFTIDDVISLAEAVEHLIEEKANRLFARARDEAGEYVTSVLDGDEADPDVQAVLRTEGPAGVFGRAALARMDYEMSEALSVTTEEIVEFDASLASRLEGLHAVIARLGSLPEDAYRNAFALNPLRITPFVEWQDRIAFPVPGLLMRDYLGVLEPVLMERVPTYAGRRAAAVEEIALELVAEALPGCRTFSNLYYWVEREGRRDRVELDGLVLFDRFAVVVEAKSTPLSLQASRGDVDRLRADLRRSIEKAGKQTARAVESILGADTVVFESRSGDEIVTLRRSEIDRVFSIAPSLHEMGGHAVVPLKMKELGLFKSFDPPWAVFLNDLRLVVDMCQNPAEFLHYMVWRSRLPLGERVTAMDEMDVFGAFMLGESALDRIELEPDLHVNLASYTTDHDDYYMWRPELGPRPNKPRKFSVPLVERFVRAQAAECPQGWLESCGAALDLTIENLGAFEGLRKPLLHAIGPEEIRIEVAGTVGLAGIGHALRVPDVLDGLMEGARGARRLIVLQRVGKKPRIVAATSLA